VIAVSLGLCQRGLAQSILGIDVRSEAHEVLCELLIALLACAQVQRRFAIFIGYV
jgi:hypothetical protein